MRRKTAEKGNGCSLSRSDLRAAPANERASEPRERSGADGAPRASVWGSPRGEPLGVINAYWPVSWRSASNQSSSGDPPFLPRDS